MVFGRVFALLSSSMSFTIILNSMNYHDSTMNKVEYDDSNDIDHNGFFKEMTTFQDYKI